MAILYLSLLQLKCPKLTKLILDISMNLFPFLNKKILNKHRSDAMKNVPPQTEQVEVTALKLTLHDEVRLRRDTNVVQVF